MLKLGCAKADTTPDFPVYLRGYGVRSRKTAVAADRLETGVIALEQEGRTVLLITADLEGIHIDHCRLIGERLRKEFGVGFPELFISSSHTHFSPGFSAYAVTVPGGELPMAMYPPDEAYFEFWYARTREAVRRALDDREAVTMESAAIPVPGIAFNRRTVRKSDGMVETNYVLPENPDDYLFNPIDPEFTVWRFRHGDRLKAVLGRYGCHPVSGTPLLYEISSDYPGAFQRAVQREYGCPGFFLLGTAGDVVPMKRSLQARRDMGEILARMIHLNDLQFRPEPDLPLAASSFTVRGTLKRLAETDDLEGYWRQALEDARRTAVAGKAPGEDESYLKLRDAAYRYLIAKRFGAKDFDIPIQLLRLGRRVLVALPFEILTDFGLKLRAACPEATVVSMTGGYEDYLPLAADFAKGGYETESEADFLPDTGDRVLAECVKQIRDISSNTI